MAEASPPAGSDWTAMRVGAAVGLTDVAVVYPWAVIATRRENGQALRHAIGQGRLWSGGMAASTMLLPYSMLVETLSGSVNRRAAALGLSERDSMAVAAATTAAVATLGTQPIEKKLVLDQMLQDSKAAAPRQPLGPLRALAAPTLELAAYAQAHGMRALYGGMVALYLRELTYMAAITAVNPIVTAELSKPRPGEDPARGFWRGFGGSLAVGGAAGIASAPFQTVNAMAKSEENRGTSSIALLRRIFRERGLAGGWHRLYYGAATRSVRTALISSVYYSWRKAFN